MTGTEHATDAASDVDHCRRCGRPCVAGVSPAPECPVHGPQWHYIRSAPCAAIIVEGPDGRIALGRRNIEPWLGWWECPGGYCDLGEHPADTVGREALEELGLVVSVDRLLGVYVHDVPDDPSGNEWRLVTMYAGRAAGDLVPDPDEVSDAAWFDPRELPERTVPGHRARIDDFLAGVPPVDVGRVR